MSKPFIGGFFMNKILKSKKIRTTLYIVGVLWIAVISQVIVNQIYMDDSRITDAFTDTNTNIEESKLNLVVDYGTQFLLNSEKEKVLNELATIVGLVDWEMQIETSESGTTLKIEDNTKGIDTSIEFISITHKEGKENISYNHFILLQLLIKEHYQDVIEYKKDVEKYVNGMEVKDYQCTMKFTGSYDGKLTKEENSKKVKELLNCLEAKQVESISSESYYTTYAYTGLVEDYIKVAGKRININIATSYDEEKDKTELYLATPILNEEY